MSLLDILEDDTVEGLIAPAELIEAYRRDQPEVVAYDSESPHYKWSLPGMDPFCFTFSWRKKRTFYMETKVDGELDPAAAEALYVILTQTPHVVAHHQKYDLHVANRFLSACGLPLVVRPIDDTMLLSHCLNENRFHGLKELTTDLGISFHRGDADEPKKRIVGWIEEQTKLTGVAPGYDQVPRRLMVPYARADAYLTLELFNHFQTEMDEVMEKSLAKQDVRDIYDLECELLWVVFSAEERGIRVDLDFCYDKIAELTPQIAHIRAKLSEELGWEMNPGSTDDVARALESLGCGDVVWVNPKTGKANLPEWRLEELANDPAAGSTVKDVLEYRTASKMVNSYFETLIEEHRLDGDGQAIVRPNIKQTGARTGRMSVTEPALQTLPREKGNVRGAFVAREGHTLALVDYAAQELRVLAHYLERVGDPTMAEIFRSGVGADLHAATASAIYGVPLDQVTKHQRRDAKTLNFAIVYGAGQKKIATMLGMELEEAKALLGRYYAAYPGLRKLKSQTEKAMRDRGYIVTVFGRRHREKDLRKTYKAINSLVQGTAADVTKRAMANLGKLYHENGLNALILMAVHDEIVSEIPDGELDQAKPLIRRAMCDMPLLSVPLEIDASYTKRWSEK